MKEKYAAPALERGVHVIEVLARDGAMTLEALVKRTGYPKASLVRFTETLMRMGLLIREKDYRKFRTLVKLAPIEDSSTFFNQKRQLIMRRLADEACATVEWYLPEVDKVTIRERSEPEHVQVFVRASVGFSRTMGGELEAVARVALASGLEAPEDAEYWEWLKGRITPVDPSRVPGLIEAASEARSARDVEYNKNGVRRYAASVFDGSGFLKGILALAESFTPLGDETAEEKLATLRAAADELEYVLREISG